MDEGTAAEPESKPNWWSRPRRDVGGLRGVEAEPALTQSAEQTGAAAVSETAAGSSGGTTAVPGGAAATPDPGTAADGPAAVPRTSTAPDGPVAVSAGTSPASGTGTTSDRSAPAPGTGSASDGPAALSAGTAPTPGSGTAGDRSAATGAAPTEPPAMDSGRADTAPAAAAPMDSASASEPSAPQQKVQPRHAPDPYGTPPYGEPGPWAPAPPVQRPVATPPHGTPVPSPAVSSQATPSHGLPAATAPAGPAAPATVTSQLPHGAAAGNAPTGAYPLPHQYGPGPRESGHWQQYDPWGAPRLTGAAPAGTVEAPRRPSHRGSLLVGALVLALVAGGIGGGIGAYVERNGGITEVELPQASAEAGDRDPESVAGIAAAALPGVVTLHVKGSDAQGTGTGFLLDKRGHILTNNHVVAPAGSDGGITVTFSGGESAPAEVVGRDSGYDLAVVKVRGVSGLKPLALGNSDSVRVGDPVVAIGAPFDLAGTVTTGIISAKERPITAGGEKGDGSDISYVDALQTDAPINPGNSGGPLVDSRARVIGINSAIKAADGGPGLEGDQGGSIGLGFAIPINQGKRVAEELINTGRATHPVIGVTLDLQYSGDGARVATRAGGGGPVKRGGPGDQAGIEPGDVITEVDGARVHSGEELIVKIRSHRPGDRLRLTLERDGERRTLRLTLGSASGR
ncbi:trypsin-like peptidase domain-containing protein [Streptomyces sp. 8N706]|uniref:trypsin-like peptidase domain-containing protein n=1 Tax=Streptomyces sp. 8N706 TaxID=3457416 RepID=UPI003FD5CFB6